MSECATHRHTNSSTPPIRRLSRRAAVLTARRARRDPAGRRLRSAVPDDQSAAEPAKPPRQPRPRGCCKADRGSEARRSGCRRPHGRTGRRCQAGRRGASVRQGRAEPHFNPAKITRGKLAVVQSRDFHPDHNTFVEQKIRQFAEKMSYPLDHSWAEAYAGAGNVVAKLTASVQAGDAPTC